MKKPERPAYVPAYDTQPQILPAPSFHVEEKLPTRERWLWGLLIVVALAIGAFLLYQRRAPVSSASIQFHASSDDQTVQLAWDVNSRAIRDSERGEIDVSDGAINSQLPLTADQLRTCKSSYKPRSTSVIFAMTVYPTNGEPIRESTQVSVPLPPVPMQAPVPSAPAKESPQRGSRRLTNAERDALQQQVQRLRDELGRERARANQLQNLVRILEARQGIHPDAPDAKTNQKP
jgi:hypothetical protein